MEQERKLLVVKNILYRKKYQIIMASFTAWLAWVSIYNICGLNNPFKIIDPENSHFELRKFNITDYGTNEKLNEALIKLFPIGTPRHVADTIMILGGAKPKQDPEESYLTYYTYRTRFSWYFDPKRTYRFVYDSDHKLLNIHLPTNQKLFINSIGIKEIKDKEKLDHTITK